MQQCTAKHPFLSILVAPQEAIVFSLRDHKKHKKQVLIPIFKIRLINCFAKTSANSSFFCCFCPFARSVVGRMQQASHGWSWIMPQSLRRNQSFSQLTAVLVFEALVVGKFKTIRRRAPGRL
jgi:hypothetical protein